MKDGNYLRLSSSKITCYNPIAVKNSDSNRASKMYVTAERKIKGELVSQRNIPASIFSIICISLTKCVITTKDDKN